MQTITLFPLRANCPSLSGSLIGIIRSLHGVDGVRAHYETRALEITFDETVLPLEDIIVTIGRETGLAFGPQPPVPDEQNTATDKTC